MTPAEHQRKLRDGRKRDGLCLSCGEASRPGKNKCGKCQKRASACKYGICDPKYNKTLGNHFQWNDELRSLIDGLLLGDASLHQTSSVAASLVISVVSRNADWMEHLSQLFTKHGIKTIISEIPGNTSIRDSGILKGRTIKSNPKVGLRTISYRTLMPERQRWYPNHTKIIPKDLNLSPLSIAQWYMGDGCLTNKREKFRIKFSTDGFNEEDVSFLRDQIEELYKSHGCVNFMPDHQPYLIYNFSNAIFLLRSMKPFIVPSFGYKIDNLTYDLIRCVICNEYTGQHHRKYHKECRKFERLVSNRAVRHRKLGIKYSREDIINSARRARSISFGLPVFGEDPVAPLSRYRRD